MKHVPSKRSSILLGTLALLFTIVALTTSIKVLNAQPRVRYADSIPNFMIFGQGGIDRWGGTEKLAIDSAFDTVHHRNFRYYYNEADSILGMNMFVSGGLDFPALLSQPQPIPDSLALTSKYNLPYLQIGSTRIGWVFNNCSNIRFQCERHPSRAEHLEYPGFQIDSIHPNVGINAHDPDGTSPLYLKISPTTIVDTLSNVVKLRHGTDAAGVFDDSLWNVTALNMSGRGYLWQESGGKNNKGLMRFRVRIDDATVSNTSNDTLFVVRMVQQHSNGWTKVLANDTVRVNSNFHHIGTGFDTIDVPFWTSDSAASTWFQLRWLGKISMTADYMEVMTRKIDSATDFHWTNDSTASQPDSLHFDGWVIPGPTADWMDGDSYEGMIENHDARLKALVDTIVKHYNTHANLVGLVEEPPFGKYDMIKRFMKLLRDGSRVYSDSTHTHWHAGLEAALILHDSAGGVNASLVNDFQAMTEGVRLGWYDSSLYADPKVFFIEPYYWYIPSVPFVKRNAFTDSVASYNWQLRYASSEIDSFGNRHFFHDIPYSRDYYLTHAQAAVNSYITEEREAKRVCMRNDVDTLNQRFITAMQAGSTPRRVVPSLDTGREVIVYGQASLRAMTAPEYKVTMHLATSCGSSGIDFYLYTDNDQSNPTSDPGGNGGFMTYRGQHKSNFVIDSFVKSSYGVYHLDSLWSGFTEDFDSIKALIPTLHVYGDTLMTSKFVGDIIASESYSDAHFPFVAQSIRSYDTTGAQDWMSSDPRNGTFVHISTWIDTLRGQTDTLLYITNMRTDDSYDSSGKPSAIDRRVISLQLKAAHLATDVIDTGATRYLDNQRIWTPYVGALDSLKVQLNAGDGILVRLSAPPLAPTQQMQVAINYPLPPVSDTFHVAGVSIGDSIVSPPYIRIETHTHDFFDHGRVNADHAVHGTKLVNGYQSVPSTWHSYLGINNSDSLKLQQDSLLYQSVPTRKGNWRNQNWTRGASSITFLFKDTLAPTSILLPQRLPQISKDSIAHAITIKTDLENRGSGGAVKLFDPWFVDSSTFRNYNTNSDTLLLNSPFLPFVAPLNGGIKQHYGGLFLKQNDKSPRDSTLPMYGLSTYKSITSDTYLGNDTNPRWTDWSFIEWWKNDDLSTHDPEDWTNYTLKQKGAPVVFRHDSSTYIARYKAHMASFTGGPLSDAGFSWNNQRKVFYLHTDSLGNPWYRVVYSSAGRIFTALGWRNHVTSAMTFLPERLISDWSDTSAMFPAMSFHGFTTPEDTAFHYVFNAYGGQILFGQFVHDSLHSTIYYPSITQGLYSATPVISGTDPDFGYGREPLDVIAWHAWDGTIHVAAADLVSSTPMWISSEYVINPPLFNSGSGLYDTIEARPSIWMDSVWTYSGGFATTHFWLAYQARDTVQFNPTDTESFIYAIELQAVYDGMHAAPTITTVPSQPALPTNITKIGNPAFISGKHCCISGCRIKSDTEVVRVSFEALENPIAGIEGISVVQWRTGRGWVADHFFQSPNASTDKYTNPSIEVSRYHGAATSAPHDNYYSLSHERMNGMWTQNWAFDSAASRYTPSNVFFFLNTNHPQLSVVPNSHDSLIRQMGQSAAAVDPLWIIYNTGGVFKMGGNDSLWQYHAVSEFDSSGRFSVKAQIGEISYDDGSSVHNVDLADRDDALTIDSSHKAPFFLSSEAFTLPSTGSLSYYFKLAPSNDSLYRLHLDTMKYALAFVDTTGVSFMVDSMLISDSTTHITGSLRTVTLNQGSAVRGHLELRRLTLRLRETGAQWQDIITQSRLSADSSYKRGKASVASDEVMITAIPNPLHDQTSIGFALPQAGAVTLEVHDALGRRVTALAETRMFHAGDHTLIWNTRDLPSGIYVAVLRYGNSLKTLRLSVLK